MTDEKLIDDVLCYLELADESQPGKSRYHNLDSLNFNGSQLIHKKDIFGTPEKDWPWPSDVTVKDLGNKYDSKLLMFNSPLELDSKLCMHRFRNVAPKEVRGRVHRFLPNPSEMSSWVLKNDDTYYTARTVFGCMGSKWVDLIYRGVLFNGPNRPGTKEILAESPEEQKLIRAHLGIEFSNRYNWHAVIGYSPERTIKFATDPYGAQELFKLRDIPNGKMRRTALRNWVREHWRQKRGGDETSVRKHLRGATDFRWNGMFVKLVPSEYDLETNEKLGLKYG